MLVGPKKAETRKQGARILNLTHWGVYVQEGGEGRGGGSIHGNQVGK